MRTSGVMRASALALTALLTACAVGPDFHTPAAPSSPGYEPGAAPPQVQPVGGPGDPQTLNWGAAPDAQWWRGFGSPQLDALIEEALRANPDLKSADAALRQANELSAAQRGALLPSVDAGYQAQRAKSSDALSPVLNASIFQYSLHTAQVNIAYTLDVFGGVRRADEAAQAQADAQRFQYEAARTSLISNVIAAVAQEAALRNQTRSAEDAAAAARDVLDFTRRQAALGALGQADVAAAEAGAAQADQAVPPLQKALAQQRTALAILLGREPGQGSGPDIALDALGLPKAVPVALPSQLVRQRPDVRAAEANLHAAGAEVGVAIAARLPNIALAAGAGGSSTDFGRMFSSADSFWTLSAGVAQPIFQGGALRHRQKAAEAALDQAKAQYRSTVLGALKNVADSLDALSRDSQALGAAQTAQVAADRSLHYARTQLALGQIGSLTERAAEQAAAQAHGALAAAIAARYADTAALFQALGGGWSDQAKADR